MGSEGDAFAAPDWSTANNWANPPWTLFPRLVDLLEALPSVHATVLAPYWPGRPWFRRLHQLAWALVPVARGPSTFLAGRTGHLPMGLPRWRIVAFRIDKPAPLPPLMAARSSREWRRLARISRLRWLQPYGLVLRDYLDRGAQLGPTTSGFTPRWDAYVRRFLVHPRRAAAPSTSRFYGRP